MVNEKAVLGVADYIILTIMLLASACIGVYFRFSGGKQKTTEEYLMAGKDMSILPVAFSLMASFKSSVTVLGVPAEIYRFGIYYAYLNVSYAIGIILSSYLLLPVFFDMQAATAYEYLERRFGKLARTLTSSVFVVQMILYVSVVLYAPALVLSAVTNLTTWVSVISIGVVCTFYCTLGGMKAVLWTDFFQASLMFLGIVTVLTKGIIDIGGVNEVFSRASEGGRVVFPGFELDPQVRYTFWNILLQGAIVSMSSFGCNQVQVQRLLTVKSLSRSRKALYWSIPMSVGFNLLSCLVGIAIYSYYYNCDPLTSPEKPISSADQLMPYYMMLTLRDYPGLPGLYICGVFSASLSTVSSAVNSLSAVTVEDFLKPFFVSRGVSQKKRAFSAKAITLSYGLLCVALTFLVATFGNLVQASMTVFGMLGAPVLAVFCLGMLTTRVNEKGVIIGLLGSVGIAAWISFGASAAKPRIKVLPVSIEGCLSPNASSSFELTTLPFSTIPPTDSVLSNFSSSFLRATESSNMQPLQDDIFPLYKLSFMWFGPIGFASAVVIGYVASIIINLFTGKTKEVPKELLSPLLRRFLDKTPAVPERKMSKSASIELNEAMMFSTYKTGQYKEKERY